LSESVQDSSTQDDPKKAQQATDVPESEPTADTTAAENEPNTPPDPVEVLKTQLGEWEGRYKYLYAEFENFKKRVQKEKSDLAKFAWEPAAQELLMVIDNLERALAHTQGADQNLMQGLNMILDLFRATLDRHGVKVIPAAGQMFDPNLHEAVAQEASADIAQGQIIREEMKGYTLHGRLLRPTRAVVSSGPEGAKKDEK